jgi:hypothetical protein
MKPAILSANTSYSFSDYLKLVDYLEDILAYFAYSFHKQLYQLPRYPGELASLPLLKARFEKNLPYISLTNEAAKREFLIAPLLLELIEYTQAKIKVEFPLVFNDQLKGTLDYYLQAQNNLLVIEAKNSDLERGFVQLAVELIALDQWTDSPASHLYGAVSTGEIWRFGILERVTKHITQDLNLFRVPADLEELMRSLVAILKV